MRVIVFSYHKWVENDCLSFARSLGTPAADIRIDSGQPLEFLTPPARDEHQKDELTTVYRLLVPAKIVSPASAHDVVTSAPRRDPQNIRSLPLPRRERCPKLKSYELES